MNKGSNAATYLGMQQSKPQTAGSMTYNLAMEPTEFCSKDSSTKQMPSLAPNITNIGLPVYSGNQ